jgi:hypothetical protein
LAAPFFFFQFLLFRLAGDFILCFLFLGAFGQQGFCGYSGLRAKLDDWILKHFISAGVFVYVFPWLWSFEAKPYCSGDYSVVVFFSRWAFAFLLCFPCFWTLLRPGGNGMDNSGIGNTKRPVDLK